MFQKATRTTAKLRMALMGPSGSGKTLSALAFARHLAEGGKIAVIDTEHGSASLYSGQYDFDVCELTSFEASRYIEAIQAAEKAGYAVLVIDSLSHAWSGVGGALEQVDKIAQRQNGNKFTAWGQVTPLHNRLIDTILASPMHILATLRTKTEYILETDARGKAVPKKVGLAPIQRDGTEYEFTIVAEIDLDHRLTVTKSRCPAVDGVVVEKPQGEWIQTVKEWLQQGSAPAMKPSQTVTHAPNALDAVASLVAPSSTEKVSREMRERIGKGFEIVGIEEVAQHAYLCNVLQRDVEGLSDLTEHEATYLLEVLRDAWKSKQTAR